MKIRTLLLALTSAAASVSAAAAAKTKTEIPAQTRIENSRLEVSADQKSGAYTLRSKENGRLQLSGAISAQINHHWLRAADYPRHEVKTSNATAGSELVITYSGLPAQPDLICSIRLSSASQFAEIEVTVRNSTSSELTVESIRPLDGRSPFFSLDGPASGDRVLSDSFSEDRPDMALHDFADVPNDTAGTAKAAMHRAVGSQLIYNRESRQSLFVGALTSEKFLTVIRLHVAGKDSIAGYEVDSTGTTELAKENSLRQSPAEDQIELSLPLAPGQSLASEPIVAGFSSDYHSQLEAYGETIRRLHAPRITAPTPIGWWSWTAYYFGLTEGPALTNAEFLSQRLKDFGYTFFHIDEGYQFARGDYTTVTASKFPHGMKSLEQKVQQLGLTPGIWTAPFEIADRSYVYLNHKDWLVHNAKGEPIHAGWVLTRDDAGKDMDPLYIIDTTNPGAQQYLRQIYTTLAREWGIRYIKLDFMDDSAIEGYYYRPHTTALEAQRIGLKIIRDAVGDDVLLDKDGSVMLNPVGLVDTGRISCDTGHSFSASRDAAPGIAARYYMNRNFYIADPDAFSISRESSAAQGDHGGPKGLRLEDAQVAIALAAVSGGMFEVGDDLPTLFLDSDRVALLENRDLLEIVRNGRSARPLDLMSYAPEDEMPSIFLLRESKRQSILTVFNWTDKEREHNFSFGDLFSDPKLASQNAIYDVFAGKAAIGQNQSSVPMQLAPHSVRMLKIIDTSVPASPPALEVSIPQNIEAGKSSRFAAQNAKDGVPAIGFHWDFGDGVSLDGAAVTHAYTHAGSFTVTLKAEGIEGVPFEKTYPVTVTGTIDTIFRPELYQRLPPEDER